MARLSSAANDVSDSSETTYMSPLRSEKEELEVVEDSKGQRGARTRKGKRKNTRSRPSWTQNWVNLSRYILTASPFASQARRKLTGTYLQNKNEYHVEWQGHPNEDNSKVVEEDVPDGAHQDVLDAEESSKQPNETISEGSPESLEPDSPLNAGSTSIGEDDNERPAKKHQNTENTCAAWDQLIEHVDTVECVGDVLYVYFTLQVPSLCAVLFFLFTFRYQEGRQTSQIRPPYAQTSSPKWCAPLAHLFAPAEEQHLSQLIDFYESKLRWKDAGE
ncbi:hypothetical protein B0H13DRAFT_2303843 [Mycena leptocephala]|nr:hypothetical protein B0H13DRAFT_2303843 [Mycena leptocephala]